MESSYKQLVENTARLLGYRVKCDRGGGLGYTFINDIYVVGSATDNGTMHIEAVTIDMRKRFKIVLAKPAED